jgi:small subunit ribosomal protein S20
MKTAIKQFMTADTMEQRSIAMKVAQRMVDRAATKNVLHKNAAARKKSQLARAYNAFITSHT